MCNNISFNFRITVTYRNTITLTFVCGISYIIYTIYALCVLYYTLFFGFLYIYTLYSLWFSLSYTTLITLISLFAPQCATFINHCISASNLRPLFKPSLFIRSLVSTL